MQKPLIDSLRLDSGGQVVTLASISPHAAKALHQIGTVRKWPHGKVLLMRGQTTNSVFVVISGRLRATVMTIHGEEQLLRWLEPGEVTGLNAVVTGSIFSSDLITSGETEVLTIERENLLKLLQHDAETGLALIRVLSMRVNQLIDKISDNAFVKLEEKVWSVLVRLANYNGTPVPNGLLLNISQDDIAHAVAASRQNVNIQLKKLQSKGLIKLGYRNILVLSK